MEVGAVKQAFNNEVILLKKNLNQARIQIIHKLTRKAKTLTEKKAPEHLKEKFKKKAEATVNEVLLMKKIKARDIAQFAITHKQELKTYLNKPQADKDKACARLLLHKALQQKYKLIRDRFGDVPIQDLFMSRLERRKLKKEQKEARKAKKEKNKIVHSEGDWDVEDMDLGDVNGDESDEERVPRIVNGSDIDEEDQQSENEHSEIENDLSDADDNQSEVENDHSKVENDHSEVENNYSEDENDHSDVENDLSDVEIFKDSDKISDKNTDSDSESNVGSFVKLTANVKTQKNKINIQEKKEEIISKVNKKERKTSIVQDVKLKLPVTENSKSNKKQLDKKVKEHKNKNLKDKLQNRKFKKDDTEDFASENKVVDPFFITATGENYLSLAEPRQPDEIKEIHKQGNRKERRAAMFGHVPNIKPRRDGYTQNYNNYRSDNDRTSNKFNRIGNDRESSNENSKYPRQTKFNSFNSSKFGKTNDKIESGAKEEKQFSYLGKVQY